MKKHLTKTFESNTCVACGLTWDREPGTAFICYEVRDEKAWKEDTLRCTE